MTGDHLTTLTAVEPGKLATKRITCGPDGDWQIRPYDHATWFSVRQVQVHDLVSLGQALADLGRDSRDEVDCWLSGQPRRHPERSFVIRGKPLPGINFGRARRLLYPQIDDDEAEHPATFGPKPRRWLALDFDDLPVPEWNLEDLTRRREAIERDPATPQEPWPLWRIDEPFEIELEDDGGDADPVPIDPVHGSELVCRAAVATLPPEFGSASAWWQMTSSAALKPGIRIRLWYWLDRPVSDHECKRWLKDSPVDRSLCSPVQAHYVAAPIFDPPELDPVPIRSGFWWRLTNTVQVPKLPEPTPPETVDVDDVVSGRWRRWEGSGDFLQLRAERYAEEALKAVAGATTGDRHPKLMAVAVRLYSLADAGFLDHADLTRRLLAAAEVPLSAAERRQRCTRQDGRPSANEDALDWARARAKAALDLPEGFAP